MTTNTDIVGILIFQTGHTSISSKHRSYMLLQLSRWKQIYDKFDILHCKPNRPPHFYRTQGCINNFCC